MAPKRKRAEVVVLSDSSDDEATVTDSGERTNSESSAKTHERGEEGEPSSDSSGDDSSSGSEREFKAEMRKRAAKVRRAERADEARQAVQRFRAPLAVVLPGKLPWGDGRRRVWALHVLIPLRDSMRVEPDALCGPSVVIARLLALAATCKQLRHMIIHGVLPELTRRLPKRTWKSLRLKVGQSDLRGFFAEFLNDPQSRTVDELKAAAKQVTAPNDRVRCSGSKDELILELLRWAGLEAPTRLPAALVLAVKHERREICPYGSNLLWFYKRDARTLQKRRGAGSVVSLFDARAHIAQAYGIATEAEWRALVAKRHELDAALD